RLVPDLPSEGMVRETLGLLVQAIGVEDLHRVKDPRVKRALAIMKQAAVCDLVGQRMLERIFHFRNAAGLVQEIRRLKVGEPFANSSFRDVGDRFEKPDVDVSADEGRSLKQPLTLEWKTIDAGSKNGLHGSRPLNAAARMGKPVGAGRAHKDIRLCEATHCLLEKERVAIGPVD